MKKLWMVVTAAVVLAVPVGMLPGDEQNTPRHEPLRGERVEPRTRTIDWFSTESDVGKFEGTVNAPPRTLKVAKSALWDRTDDKERAGAYPISTVSNAPTAPLWASRGVRTVQCHRCNEQTR